MEEAAEEQTLAHRILRALEDMSKAELVVLCQNLEQTIRNRDDEIDRINSHYEHLLSLYYEAEEKLALLNQELFLSRAQTYTSLEWSTALSTGESIQADQRETTTEHTDGDQQQSVNAEKVNKPPANPRHKAKTRSVSRKPSDFLSKTMTPVLHRRASAQNRGENACAKSTPHAPIRNDNTSHMTSSWSEPFGYRGNDINTEEGAKMNRRQEHESADEESSDDYEDDELSRDKGVTINDVNILKIHHDGSQSSSQLAEGYQDTDDFHDSTPDPYGAQPTSRVLTPFHSERPLTAETAGSDGSRPPTGEKRQSPTQLVKDPEWRDKGNSNDDGHSEEVSRERDYQKMNSRSLGQSTGGVAWSLDVKDTLSSSEQKSPSAKRKSAARNDHSKSSQQDCRGKPASRSVNFEPNAIDIPANENRNSHNNNITTPDGVYCNQLSTRSMAIGYEVSERPEDNPDTPIDFRAAGYSGRSSASASRGISPSHLNSLQSEQQASIGMITTPEKLANQGGVQETPPRPISDLFRFSTLNLKCVDELDRLHKTPRGIKVKSNRRAIFGSYDSLKTAIDADTQAERRSARYPARIPHVPTEPKRPNTCAPANFRRRSKSLNQTFPPNRSSSGQTVAKKPPSGAFDFSKLRQRNKAVLMKGPVVVEKQIDCSPGPLQITAIRRPLAASCDTTLNYPKPTDYGLRWQPQHSSLENLQARDVSPCINRSSDIATPSM